MLSHRCVQELVEMRIGLGSIQNLRAHHQNERVLPDRCLTDDDLLAARYFHIGGDCDASQNPLELYKYEAGSRLPKGIQSNPRVRPCSSGGMGRIREEHQYE